MSPGEREQRVITQWEELANELEQHRGEKELLIDQTSREEFYPETIMKLEKYGYRVDSIIPGIILLTLSPSTHTVVQFC